MNHHVSRRGFFVAAVAAAGAVLQDSSSAGRVYDPGRAGRALPPVTAVDNDAATGKTAQQITDAFVAQYGEQALMSPPRRGFNLAGYFVPSVVVLIAGIFLFLRLRRWTRDVQAGSPTVDGLPPPNASAAELERLRQELDRLPG